jgi:hypothetical protein
MADLGICPIFFLGPFRRLCLWIPCVRRFRLLILLIDARIVKLLRRHGDFPPRIEQQTSRHLPGIVVSYARWQTRARLAS